MSYDDWKMIGHEDCPGPEDMGYVKEELAEKDQTVKGIIIALEDDTRIKRALAVANNIEFYRYQVSFKLFKS